MKEPALEPSQHTGLVLAGDQTLPPVNGTLKALECGAAQIRLRLRVENRDVLFVLPKDPKDVLIRNAGKQEIQMNCGSLQPQELTKKVNFEPVVGQSATRSIRRIVRRITATRISIR